VLAVVAAGGALGAVARYGLELLWPHPAGAFPWVTLLINVTGCAALGAIMELLADLTAPHRLARPFLGTGLLGGFTTFSAYAVETRQLLAAGRPAVAAAYVVGTLVAALAGVWGGMMGVRAIVRRRA
jgi:CrcB protein